MSKEITVVIPTSVIPSHPSTELIEETIKNIRIQLPESEIILQIDGIREEQLHRKDQYDEYINRVLWKCLHEWKNVLPIVFDEHSHQTTMMKKTIGLINTEFMVYVESDAPIVPDEYIDWDLCLNFIKTGKAKTIRFHHEAVIPKEHKHLMFGIHPQGFMSTCQWSQRPHLTTVEYYRNVVLPESLEKAFIEDQFHGVVQEDYKLLPDNGGFKKHKLWIYYPNNGKNIKRSYHLDGRKGLKKFTSDDDSWGFTEE